MAAKKTTAKKAPAEKKAPAAKSAGGKAGSAFMKPMQPSPALAEIVGNQPQPRTEVVSKMWDYIKKHNLQDPANKRQINADDKLRPIFGKDSVTMFEMTALVNKNLSNVG
jgi:upstream activation factor subunit UAF30